MLEYFTILGNTLQHLTTFGKTCDHTRVTHNTTQEHTHNTHATHTIHTTHTTHTTHFNTSHTESLKKSFLQVQYQVIKYFEVSADNMREYIDMFLKSASKSAERGECDMTFFFFIGHGTLDCMKGHDEKAVNIGNITRKFKNWKSLKGKPKVNTNINCIFLYKFTVT